MMLLREDPKQLLKVTPEYPKNFRHKKELNEIV